jgi:glycosyltransferase involved in cell wall biosynthesis
MLLPGILGARLTGAKLVYDSHELATSVPYRQRSWAWFVAFVERMIVPRCAAVITVSDGIAARLRERYKLAATPTVLRNVSALKGGDNGGLRRLLGLQRTAPLVLHQGAPAPDRGCEVLVEATALLPGVHLVFLGDPEPGYGKQLEGKVQESGIGDRVWVLPSVPLERLIAYTAEADVGVALLQDTCENHRLALPNKLFEYLAARVPVVVSALPEMERLVTSYGVGRCARPSDPRSVATAIRDVLALTHDPTFRSRLDHAAQSLNWTNERLRLLDLYAELGALAGASSSQMPGEPALLGQRSAPGATPNVATNQQHHDGDEQRTSAAADRQS